MRAGSDERKDGVVAAGGDEVSRTWFESLRFWVLLHNHFSCSLFFLGFISFKL